jgi:alkanesulfonate monooxygenase SsuD/methylene tetrahydromethanopterin reductase-like flavin-dependent oxidoreductase (luciferase family)
MYRAQFKPSESLSRPHTLAGVAIVAAPTDAEARRLLTSAHQQFLNLRRGRPGQVPPPVDSMDDLWTPAERAGVEHALSLAIVGAPDTVRAGLERFVATTGVDEVMVTAQIYDHDARVRSYEIVAEVSAMQGRRF